MHICTLHITIFNCLPYHNIYESAIYCLPCNTGICTGVVSGGKRYACPRPKYSKMRSHKSLNWKYIRIYIEVHFPCRNVTADTRYTVHSESMQQFCGFGPSLSIAPSIHRRTIRYSLVTHTSQRSHTSGGRDILSLRTPRHTCAKRQLNSE